MQTFELMKQPVYVGYWCLTPNFRIPDTVRPNWLHRVMRAAVLGIVWKDAK